MVHIIGRSSWAQFQARVGSFAMHATQCRSVPERMTRSRITLTTPSRHRAAEQSPRRHSITSSSSSKAVTIVGDNIHTTCCSCCPQTWPITTKTPPSPPSQKSRLWLATTPTAPSPNLFPVPAAGSACSDEGRWDRRTSTRSKVTSSCRGFSSSRRSAATVKTSSG